MDGSEKEINVIVALALYTAIGGICKREFTRPTAIDRKMICVYEKE